MIFVGLGSNQGNRAAFLSAARAALEAHDIEIRAESSIVETPALLPEGAPAEWNIPYLNQVLKVKTYYAPIELLMILKQIETELGRVARGHWAPREIDLDLLAYDDQIIVTDALVLPHPQMDNRAFVLAPLAEISGDWVHPIFNKTADELLRELPV